jgi:hypothetical protein
MRLQVAIALPLLVLAAAAGGYAFKPAAAPQQQLAPQPPRAVQPTSVTTFSYRWEALGQQAAAMPTTNRSIESVAASMGPMALAEEPPQQIDHSSSSSRRRAARLGGGEVCARHGLRRVDYRKNGHLYWRCA